MRIAYLILAHDDPAHLARLVRALSHGEDRCFVHVDAKASLDRFAAARIETAEFIAPRVAVHWGDFSQVEAMHALLSAAFGAEPEYDYFALLSGADYPLQPAWYINDYVRRRAGTEFMSAVKLPCEEIQKSLARLERYQYRPTAGLARRGTFRLQVALGLRSATRPWRPVFGELEPFGGSAWWALSRAAVRHVLRFVEERPEVISFYENVRCGDESLFHTIILNSPFRAKVGRNLTYADWRRGGSRPARLTDEHVTRFESQPLVMLKNVYGSGEALFARKLSDADGPLVDRLDRMIARRDLAHAATRDDASRIQPR